MNLKEMIARQQSLLDGAKAEGRELTAEERAEFDSLQRSMRSPHCAVTSALMLTAISRTAAPSTRSERLS